MRRTLKLTIAYDGTAFHGWQAQAGVRTVQDELKGVLRRVLREPVNAVGASRTDAGVHARGQVAHVVTEAAIPTDKIRRAVDHRLPDDLSLLSVLEVADDFHATRDAVGKLYRYTIFNSRAYRPTDRGLTRSAWHVWHSLDFGVLRSAAGRLVGTHDFAGFANAGSPRETTVRTVTRMDVRSHRGALHIDVAGDGFLYNQVRNMVGTLVEVARGHWSADRIDEILAGGQRRLAGPTAPPEGLCLQWVRYPQAKLRRPA